MIIYPTSKTMPMLLRNQVKFTFYSIDDLGYAMAVELSTSEPKALAFDAVKAGEDFDSDVYRADVNSIMKHANVIDKDILIAGNEFFKHRWNKPLDFALYESTLTPAKDVFYDTKEPE